MKKILCMAAMAVMLTAGTAAAQTKIALIDLEGAMNVSEAGKKAGEELKAEVDKVTARAKKLQDEMASISKDLEAQNSLLSQDAKQKKLGDIQRKKVELERLEKDTQEDLQRKQMQYINVMLPEIREVIAAYAKEMKIDVVLEAKEAGTIFADPKLDITEVIIKRFDESWKKKQK